MSAKICVDMFGASADLPRKFFNESALMELPEGIKAQSRTSDAASKSFLVELARVDAAAMQEAWQALQTIKQSSVRAVCARKVVASQANRKIADEAFEKIQRAFWILMKTTEKCVDKLKSEKMKKIHLLKSNLDKMMGIKNG